MDEREKVQDESEEEPVQVSGADEDAAVSAADTFEGDGESLDADPPIIITGSGT